MALRTKQKNPGRLAQMLKVYVIVFLIWTVYRIFFHLPEFVDECIAKPILWLTPLFVLKKNITGKGIKSLKINISKNIILGLNIGILFFGLFTFFSSIRIGLPNFNPSHLTLGGMLLQAVIAVSTGIVEELVFRSYFLEEALIIFHDRIGANLFVTILFALIHLPIIVFVYKYSLALTVSYLSLLTISGFVYGLVYLHKKSVLSSTVTHALWNFLGTIIR
jgi:membrane protease YdiL (CAAX protease family)